MKLLDFQIRIARPKIRPNRLYEAVTVVFEKKPL
jgi:hypothetical protein